MEALQWSEQYGPWLESTRRRLKVCARALAADRVRLRVNGPDGTERFVAQWPDTSEHPAAVWRVATVASHTGFHELVLGVATPEDRAWSADDGEILSDLARTLRDVLPVHLGGRAKEDQRLQLSRLAAAVDGLHAAVLVEDHERHIHFVNQLFCEIFRIPATPDELIGADCAGAAEQARDFFVDPKGFVERIDELLADRVPCRGERVTMRDGRVLERDYVPIFVEDRYEGHVWSYRDITRQERTRERLIEQAMQLRQLSLVDPLTELSNRRGFMTLGRQLLLQARRRGLPCVLLFVGLDGLKAINDTLGHSAGDSAIRHTGRLLRESLRECDIVARLGGDEFAALLGDTDEAGATEVVRRLRETVAHHAHEAGLPYRLELSIGTAVARAGQGLEAMLQEADARMYQEKQRRRTRRGLILVDPQQ